MTYHAVARSSCSEVSIEKLEREAPEGLFPGKPGRFAYKPWKRSAGEGGGVGGVLTVARLFEKAGIHTSSANGVLTEELARTLPSDGKQLVYLSTTVSLIIHPRSPRVLTVRDSICCTTAGPCSDFEPAATPRPILSSMPPAVSWP